MENFDVDDDTNFTAGLTHTHNTHSHIVSVKAAATEKKYSTGGT